MSEGAALAAPRREAVRRAIVGTRMMMIVCWGGSESWHEFRWDVWLLFWGRLETESATQSAQLIYFCPGQQNKSQWVAWSFYTLQVL